MLIKKKRSLEVFTKFDKNRNHTFRLLVHSTNDKTGIIPC